VGLALSVTRILTKVDGVTSLDADVESKKLVVHGTASKETIEEKLSKWAAASGKEVRFVKEI
jgi:copper chaperone CopZ